MPPVSRAFPPLGGALDQARLAAALGRIASVPVERLLARPERPAGRALAARGMPARTVEGFLRPLLAALLCDPDLTTSSRCADLALRAFASGRLCVPEGGADTLPELLASALPPGTVRTGVRVTSVSTTSVTTADHGELRCRAILVATDAHAAAELLPGLRVPPFHQVTVVHHTADEVPLTEPALLLDADRRGPVAHTAVISQVDPTRAPVGRALISSTILGAPPRTRTGPYAPTWPPSTAPPRTAGSCSRSTTPPTRSPRCRPRTTSAARSASSPVCTSAATTATPARSRAPSTRATEPRQPS